MSEVTKISWCDSTVNFWEGCTKVSPGCANCYAEERDKRHLIEDVDHWGQGAPRRKSKSAVLEALRINKRALICEECGSDQPPVYSPSRDLMCAGCQTLNNFRQRRVFTLSLGDWLDPDVPIEWLAEMLDTIRRCDQVVWILCTKRPELFEARMETVMRYLEDKNPAHLKSLWGWVLDWVTGEHVPERLWVLTSLESQAQEARVWDLRKIPAAVHGLSCEPLLGSLRLNSPLRIWEHSGPPCCIERDGWHRLGDWLQQKHSQPHQPLLDWVIAGGESGADARPCNVDWLRSLKDQCAAARVPFFMKQFGAKPVYTAANNATLTLNWDDPRYFIPWNSSHNGAPKVHHPKGGDPAEWPADLRVQQFPKV